MFDSDESKLYLSTMSDEQPPPQSPQDAPQAAPEMLLSRMPHKKVRDSDWPVIRSLAEKGVTYGELAKNYGVTAQLIRARSCKEKWLTKQRLAMTKNETIASDPATAAVLGLWETRQQDAREQVYQGAQKALARFFAMSPVPQTFAEAATANKLMKDAIDPSGSASSNGSTTVNILATQGFSPRPTIDI